MWFLTTPVFTCVHPSVWLRTPMRTPQCSCAYTTVYTCIHQCVHDSVHVYTPQGTTAYTNAYTKVLTCIHHGVHLRTPVFMCVHHSVCLHIQKRTPQCSPAYTMVFTCVHQCLWAYTTVYACIFKCVHHSGHLRTPVYITMYAYLHLCIQQCIHYSVSLCSVWLHKRVHHSIHHSDCWVYCTTTCNSLRYGISQELKLPPLKLMIMSFNIRCQAWILSASGSEVKVMVLHPVHDKTSGIGEWNKNMSQFLLWLDKTLTELHQLSYFDTPLFPNHNSVGNRVVHWVRPFWPEASALRYRVRVRSTQHCRVQV